MTGEVDRLVAAWAVMADGGDPWGVPGLSDAEAGDLAELRAGVLEATLNALQARQDAAEGTLRVWQGLCRVGPLVEALRAVCVEPLLPGDAPPTVEDVAAALRVLLVEVETPLPGWADRFGPRRG